MNHKKTCCICFTSEKVHKFPQGKYADTTERFATWANFAALENVLDHQKCYSLCEKHFEKRMFMNDLSARLVKPAFPTLHPPVYQGPPTMDGTPVSPSLPKSETLKKIYEWKEALVLSSNLPDSVENRPSHISGALEKSVKKTQDSGNLLTTSSPVDFSKSSFISTNEDIFTKNAKGNADKRPASPTVHSSETESIKASLVLKTYSRRNKFIKQDSMDRVLLGQSRELSTVIVNSSNASNKILTPTETSIPSQLLDNRNITTAGSTSVPGTSSILNTIPGQTPTQVMEPSTIENVSIMANNGSANANNISLTAGNVSKCAEIESSFTHFASSLGDKQDKETDLLSEAINNADISFNEEAQFCSDPKRKNYDPVLINSILDDMSYVENLIIYYY